MDEDYFPREVWWKLSSEALTIQSMLSNQNHLLRDYRSDVSTNQMKKRRSSLVSSPSLSTVTFLRILLLADHSNGGHRISTATMSRKVQIQPRSSIAVIIEPYSFNTKQLDRKSQRQNAIAFDFSVQQFRFDHQNGGLESSL